MSFFHSHPPFGFAPLLLFMSLGAVKKSPQGVPFQLSRKLLFASVALGYLHLTIFVSQRPVVVKCVSTTVDDY